MIANYKNDIATMVLSLPWGNVCNDMGPLLLTEIGQTNIEFRHAMNMSSNGNIFRVTGHLCGQFTGDRWIPQVTGEFPAHRPVMRNFEVFFNLHLNKPVE